jgi:hypothetical protein
MTGVLIFFVLLGHKSCFPCETLMNLKIPWRQVYRLTSKNRKHTSVVQNQEVGLLIISGLGGKSILRIPAFAGRCDPNSALTW